MAEFQQEQHEEVGKGKFQCLSVRAGGGDHLGNPPEPVKTGVSWALLKYP